MLVFDESGWREIESDAVPVAQGLTWAGDRVVVDDCRHVLTTALE